ncbi:hypothetical protein EYF80_000821 [Liparis tanakae]|uniref:Uncharacterized protein n=1 Tax=Liparis tanakae TaxID=230148 RepID=A0A4Z2JGF8_9TELE|nr:hypothetical protein EYF80_000821 [Liparis tanakae]
MSSWSREQQRSRSTLRSARGAAGPFLSACGRWSSEGTAAGHTRAGLMTRAVLTLTSALDEWLEAERARVNKGTTDDFPLPASANAA